MAAKRGQLRFYFTSISRLSLHLVLNSYRRKSTCYKHAVFRPLTSPALHVHVAPASLSSEIEHVVYNILKVIQTQRSNQ